MKRIVLLFSFFCINAQISAQNDTGAILRDLQTKQKDLKQVSVGVRLKRKSFYSTDTSFNEGSIVADYSYDKSSTFYFVSVFEDEYSRFLIYDTSGTEYTYYVKTNTVGEVKKIDRQKVNDDGLLEPLFPMILDQSQKFTEWFFLDYSRIMIRGINDSTVTLGFNGADSTNLLESPKVQLELYRNTGLPKEIITKFTLANKEVQYEHFMLNYNLKKEDLQQHKIAYDNIKKFRTNGVLKQKKSKKEKSFFYEGDKFTPLQVLSLDETKVLLTASNEKFILIDFSYIGCKPCNEAIPTLNKLSRDFSSQLEVVSINPFDKKDQILKHAQKMDVKYKVYAMQPQYFRKLAIQSFPYFVLVGKEGIITRVKIGYGENFYEKISQIINATQ